MMLDAGFGFYFRRYYFQQHHVFRQGLVFHFMSLVDEIHQKPQKNPKTPKILVFGVSGGYSVKTGFPHSHRYTLGVYLESKVTVQL